jgi:ketopantoate reductase
MARPIELNHCERYQNRAQRQEPRCEGPATMRVLKLRQPVRRIQVGQADAALDLILLACGTYDLAPAMEAIAPAVGATTWCYRC